MDIFRFQLVSLNVEEILQESTMDRKRERLSKIIDGLELEDAYGTMIKRIKAQGAGKSRVAMDALMWISHAERPLKAAELCHALAVELGSTHFKAENAPSISTVVSCCQGLISLDLKASTVRLTHFTLKEYLSSRPDIFSGPHASMAEICLTYLNSGQIRALSVDTSTDILINPFLNYSSVYWGVHAKRELSARAKSLALNLLQEYDFHVSAKLLLAQVEDLGPQCFGPDPSTSLEFNGLHCASFFGIVDIVAALLEMECYDINEGDSAGVTPLAWAANNGHSELVKMLLGRKEVSPNKPDSEGQTPLLHASYNGHEGVVEIFLGRAEVNPNQADDDGWTPLLHAVSEGHVGVVKRLLCQEEVDPNRADSDGLTPLSCAVLDGNEEVMKILLGRKEVNPDKPDNDGDTTLSIAACKGYEEMVKILLEQEVVSPDKPNRAGRTPLASAAREGHAGVVKILLGRKEVDPYRLDSNGQTPLMLAAKYGHRRVMALLQPHQTVSHRAL